jgi:predicted peptidase
VKKTFCLFNIITCTILVIIGIVGVKAYLKNPAIVDAGSLPSASKTDPMVVDGHGFIKRTFTDVLNRSITYYFYVPKNYNPHQKYPLVLLLSGRGERSSAKNNEAKNEKNIVGQTFVQVWGPDYTAPFNPEVQQHWPSFIVVPQITDKQQWVNRPSNKGSYVQTAQPSLQLLLAKELLDSLQYDYSAIDANRLYITGLSLGGLGTWDAAERWPNYFAAAVPIAGAGDPSKAARLVNLPIWAFHGSVDKSIPVASSRTMIKAIQAAGGHPKYTEFPNATHSVWWVVYSATGTSEHVNGFYNWLFAQRRK